MYVTTDVSHVTSVCHTDVRFYTLKNMCLRVERQQFVQPCLAGRILARGRMKPDQVLGFILEGLLSLLLFK